MINYRLNWAKKVPQNFMGILYKSGANLVEGSLHEVIDFLDYLSNK